MAQTIEGNGSGGRHAGTRKAGAHTTVRAGGTWVWGHIAYVYLVRFVQIYLM